MLCCDKTGENKTPLGIEIHTIRVISDIIDNLIKTRVVDDSSLGEKSLIY